MQQIIRRSDHERELIRWREHIRRLAEGLGEPLGQRSPAKQTNAHHTHHGRTPATATEHGAGVMATGVCDGAVEPGGQLFLNHPLNVTAERTSARAHLVRRSPLDHLLFLSFINNSGEQITQDVRAYPGYSTNRMFGINPSRSFHERTAAGVLNHKELFLALPLSLLVLGIVFPVYVNSPEISLSFLNSPRISL